jgi:hypothetical protein
MQAEHGVDTIVFVLTFSPELIFGIEAAAILGARGKFSKSPNACPFFDGQMFPRTGPAQCPASDALEIGRFAYFLTSAWRLDS